MSTTTRVYGFGTRVALPYDQAIERTRTALKEQGFGVLTEIDVKNACPRRCRTLPWPRPTQRIP